MKPTLLPKRQKDEGGGGRSGEVLERGRTVVRSRRRKHVVKAQGGRIFIGTATVRESGHVHQGRGEPRG